MSFKRWKILPKKKRIDRTVAFFEVNLESLIKFNKVFDTIVFSPRLNNNDCQN